MNDSTQHAEDWLPECIQAISEKLIGWDIETFSKVDLTKALQKRFKAKEIDVALSLLTLQKIIIPVPEKSSNKPGRKPSPKYRINKGGDLKDES